MAQRKIKRRDGCLCLRELVKLEVNPKKKKLATELGFDK